MKKTTISRHISSLHGGVVDDTATLVQAVSRHAEHHTIFLHRGLQRRHACTLLLEIYTHAHKGGLVGVDESGLVPEVSCLRQTAAHPAAVKLRSTHVHRSHQETHGGLALELQWGKLREEFEGSFNGEKLKVDCDMVSQELTVIW